LKNKLCHLLFSNPKHDINLKKQIFLDPTLFIQKFHEAVQNNQPVKNVKFWNVIIKKGSLCPILG